MKETSEKLHEILEKTNEDIIITIRKIEKMHEKYQESFKILYSEESLLNLYKKELKKLTELQEFIQKWLSN